MFLYRLRSYSTAGPFRRNTVFIFPEDISYHI